MEQKVILFQGGSHGNFLSRYLNVQAGIINPNSNFYNFYKGAHWYDKELKKDDLLYTCDHYDGNVKRKIFCYIYIKKEDLYKLTWHMYYAAGEFGLNLLDCNDFLDKFYSHLELNNLHPVLENSNIEYFEKNSNGLREYFKIGFKENNGFLTQQFNVYLQHDIENYFYFEDFYSRDFDQKIKDNLNIDIKIKTDNHKIFLERKKDILESENKVKSAADAFIKGQYYSLEDFCLYEQAYFDHLLEEHYGITLETFYKDYPKNTLEYEIREDK